MVGAGVFAAAALPRGSGQEFAADSAQANAETSLSTPHPFPPVIPERMEMNGWHAVSHTGCWDGWFRPHGRTQYGSYELGHLVEVDGSAAVVLRHTIKGADQRVRLDNGQGEWRVGETVRKQVTDGVTEELLAFKGVPLVAPSYVALDLRPTDPAADRPRRLVGQELEFPHWSPDWSVPEDAGFGQVIERIVGVNNAPRGPAGRSEYLVDLDDGDLLRLPANADMRHRHVVQLRHGFDVRLDPNYGFATYNLAVLEPAPDDAWNGFTPQKLAEELAQAELSTGTRVVDSRSLPADFLFKTREGGIGLLRVKQSAQQAGSLVLLIKPVDRRGPDNEVDDAQAINRFETQVKSAAKRVSVSKEQRLGQHEQDGESEHGADRQPLAAAAAGFNQETDEVRTELFEPDVPELTPGAATPAFEQLVIKIEPSGRGHHEQTEELRIEATGRLWYEVEGREAQRNLPARPGAKIHHELSAEHVRRLDRLLEQTQWLAAEGAEGPATHTHPTTVTLILRRDGQERSVVCQGRCPEPYGALLHAIHGLATQERRIYLWMYVGGEPGAHAWADIGREIAALRGGPYGEPPFEIDYSRYLPIARDIVYPFYTRRDDELIPAVRLVGHFKLASQLEFLHRMAHDRSSNLRREVAWALGRIHREESLPVLAGMMSAPASREAAGLRLIMWGEQAVPYIVELIDMSADSELEHWKHIAGEDMIRTYLDHWDKLDHPIDPRVTAAVRQALKSADPENGLIRTEYHEALLQKVKAGPRGF